MSGTVSIAAAAASAQIGQTPTVGRIVLYHPTPGERGGATDAPYFPAVITRVWSPTCVNLQVLTDAGQPFPVTSVQSSPAQGPAPERTWRWPPRG